MFDFIHLWQQDWKHLNSKSPNTFVHILNTEINLSEVQNFTQIVKLNLWFANIWKHRKNKFILSSLKVTVFKRVSYAEVWNSSIASSLQSSFMQWPMISGLWHLLEPWQIFDAFIVLFWQILSLPNPHPVSHRKAFWVSRSCRKISIIILLSYSHILLSIAEVQFWCG